MKERLEDLEVGYPKWANTEFRKIVYANLGVIVGGTFALSTCLRKTKTILKQEERECLEKTGRQISYAIMNNCHGDTIHNSEYESVAKFATLTAPPFISGLVFSSLFIMGAEKITGDYRNGLYALLATQTISGIYEVGRYIKKKLKRKAIPLA